MGVQKLQEYSDFMTVRGRLATHRPDALANLSGIGLVTWHQLADVLANAGKAAKRQEEQTYAAHASAWLKQHILSPGSV
jgi:hypothetical protein